MLKKTIGMSGFTLAEGATHVEMQKKSRLHAFTLAEVLITLGIIGVVAAMTMPTLINSTNGAQYKTAYKKALSVMSQAVVMNIALDDYDLSQTVNNTNGNGAEDQHEDETQTLYTLFKNRMNVVKVTGNEDATSTYKIIDAGDATGDKPGDGHTFKTGEAATTIAAGPFGLGTTLYFNDGIVFTFDNAQSDCTAGNSAGVTETYCFGLIDVNGSKGPNKVIRCDNNSGNGETGDEATCTVSNPTDIYPIMFYDQSIVPASAAARAVLYAK